MLFLNGFIIFLVLLVTGLNVFQIIKFKQYQSRKKSRKRINPSRPIGKDKKNKKKGKVTIKLLTINMIVTMVLLSVVLALFKLESINNLLAQDISDLKKEQKSLKKAIKLERTTEIVLYPIEGLNFKNYSWENVWSGSFDEKGVIEIQIDMEKMITPYFKMLKPTINFEKHEQKICLFLYGEEKSLWNDTIVQKNISLFVQDLLPIEELNQVSVIYQTYDGQKKLFASEYRRDSQNKWVRSESNE